MHAPQKSAPYIPCEYVRPWSASENGHSAKTDGNILTIFRHPDSYRQTDGNILTICRHPDSYRQDLANTLAKFFDQGIAETNAVKIYVGIQPIGIF